MRCASPGGFKGYILPDGIFIFPDAIPLMGEKREDKNYQEK